VEAHARGLSGDSVVAGAGQEARSVAAAEVAGEEALSRRQACALSVMLILFVRDLSAHNQTQVQQR
jgi:ethanolamine utilization protein EutA (predicted chaperonin)